MEDRFYSELDESERKIALRKNFIELYNDFKEYTIKNHFPPNLFISNFNWEIGDNDELELTCYNSSVCLYDFYRNWERIEVDMETKHKLKKLSKEDESNKDKWSLTLFAELIPLKGDNRFTLDVSTLVTPYKTNAPFYLLERYEKRLETYKSFCQENNWRDALKEIQLSELFGVSSQTHRLAEEGVIRILKAEDHSFFTEFLSEKITLFKSEIEQAWNDLNLIKDLHHSLLDSNSILFDKYLIVSDYVD